jgi:hypothetical protein
MGINYGSLQCTFYRDFVKKQEVNPSNGAVGGSCVYARNCDSTYIGSDGYLKTANANQPRFGYEYNSSNNLVYRGLLIELNCGNNMCLHSEDYNQADWSKSNCSVNSTSVYAPDGINYVQKISLSSAGGSISQSTTSSYNQSGPAVRIYHVSIFAKASECDYLNISITNGTDSVNCYFDVNSGSADTNSGAQNNLKYLYKYAKNMGNGWYRCFVGFQDDCQTTKTYIVKFTPTTSSSSLTMSNSGDGIYLWGAMNYWEQSVYPAYHNVPKNYRKTTNSIAANGQETFYASSNFTGRYNSDYFSAYAEFTIPYNMTTSFISQTYLRFNCDDSTVLYFRQLSNGMVNVLYSRPPGRYDFFGATLLENNNKGIITYGKNMQAKASFNGSDVGYSSTASIRDTTGPSSVTFSSGSLYYKKIFFVPTILTDRHMKALTLL